MGCSCWGRRYPVGIVGALSPGGNARGDSPTMGWGTLTVNPEFLCCLQPLSISLLRPSLNLH